MTVYVDDMQAPVGRMVMCHMIADTDEELHEMAGWILVDRQWFQNKPGGRQHYDISLGRRALAVKFGAKQITWRQAGMMTFIRGKTGKLGDPETCLSVSQAIRSRPRCLVCSDSTYVSAGDERYDPCPVCKPEAYA